MSKLASLWKKCCLFLIFTLAACSGGGSGGGNTNSEVLVRILNQHTSNSIESELRLAQFWFCNSSVSLDNEILGYGESTDWFDIGQGATSIMCASAFLEFMFREQNSTVLWSNLETEGAEEIAGRYLNSGERHTIIITGNGATVISGAIAEEPKLFFKDTDPDPRELAGTVRITKAQDETDIQTYELHWGLDETTPLAGGSEIETWTPASGNIEYTFSLNTPVPTGATHLLLYTTSSAYPSGTLWSQAFADISGTVKYPQPQGNHLNAIAYGNGRYVAVGNRGTILSSTNGTNWVLEDSGTARKLHGITFDQDRFLAVGDGIFLTGSGDAADWSPAVANTGVDGIQPRPEIELYNIDQCNGLFVATGYNKSILVSQDASSWLVRETGGSYGWRAAAHNGTVYVTVGRGITTSEDTITWEEQLSGEDIFNASNNELRDVLYHDNRFHAVGAEGKLLTSSDGASWDTVTVENTYLNGIIHAAGRYVMVGGGDRDEDTDYTSLVMTSDDGITWTEGTIGTVPFLNAVVYADGRFVAVGSEGLIATSVDGDVWTEISAGPYEDINAVAIGAGGIPFAVGTNGFIASWNGSSWDPIASGVDDELHAIQYWSELPGYVVVGDNSTVLTSPDAATWTQQTALPAGIILRGVAFGDGVYVAVGRAGFTGKTLRSVNGIDWSEVSTGTSTDLTCIMYADSQFVVGGSHGLLLTSPDGAASNWTQRDPATTTFLSAIVAGNGVYYAAGGYDGTVVTSSNQGVTWSQLASDSVSHFKNAGLAVNGTDLISIGFDTLYESSDSGATWSEQMLSVDTYLNDVVYTGTSFMAVGDGGKTVMLD